MSDFAVMSGTEVVNVIIAESKEIAEQVTGLTCIESTEENVAIIGGDYVDGYFYGVKPFPSWNRDGQGKWVSPVGMPEFDENNPMVYDWNEDTLSWDPRA